MGTTEGMNPIAQEEKKIVAMVDKLKSLEQAVREKEIVIDRLRELIAKCHSDCFPVELKVESEHRY